MYLFPLNINLITIQFHKCCDEMNILAYHMQHMIYHYIYIKTTEVHTYKNMKDIDEKL